MALQSKTPASNKSKSGTNKKVSTKTRSRAAASDVVEPKIKAKSHNMVGVVGNLDLTPKSTKPSNKDWRVSDFKGADYNPRYITEGRLKKLQKSMETFGDMSGVVFNRRTNRLVSGHQRLKTLEGAKTKVITKPYLDKHGTVEMGHVEAITDRGLIRIPLRIVDWSNDKVEKAANIAANSHGGEFDKDKLRLVLRDIEVKTFDIELLGLDPLTLQTLIIPDSDGKTFEQSDDFPEYDDRSFEFECACPRCGYQFNPKTKVKVPASDKRATRISDKKKSAIKAKK